MNKLINKTNINLRFALFKLGLKIRYSIVFPIKDYLARLKDFYYETKVNFNFFIKFELVHPILARLAIAEENL